MTKQMKAELIIQIQEEIEFRQEGLRTDEPMMVVGNKIYFSMNDLVEILKLLQDAEATEGGEED